MSHLLAWRHNKTTHGGVLWIQYLPETEINLRWQDHYAVRIFRFDETAGQ